MFYPFALNKPGDGLRIFLWKATFRLWAVCCRRCCGLVDVTGLQSNAGKFGRAALCYRLGRLRLTMSRAHWREDVR